MGQMLERAKRSIVAEKSGKGCYGDEFKVSFMRDGKQVYQTVVFREDLKWVNRAYTRDFNDVKLTKKWLKRK